MINSKNNIHLMINDKEDLNKFRFWYMNDKDIDLRFTLLKHYYEEIYHLPCVITLDAQFSVKTHRCVRSKGDSWRTYIDSLSPHDVYNKISTISLKTFIKVYE